MKLSLTYKILFISFWAIIAILLFFSERKMKTCINTRYLAHQEIFGVVESKEENNWNHATEVAYFTNGEKFVWSDDVWKVPGFYMDIELGDTIIKREASFVVEIHKKDTIIFFDMLKNCINYAEKKND